MDNQNTNIGSVSSENEVINNSVNNQPTIGEKPKRKYTRRDQSFWDKKKGKTDLKPILQTVVSVFEDNGPKIFKRNGLMLEPDPKSVVNHIILEEKEQYQKVHKRIVPILEESISGLKKMVQSGKSPEIDELIPESLGKVISEYSKDWSGQNKTVLTSFSECSLRTYSGIMTVIDIGLRHILELENELDELKRRRSVTPPEGPVVEPIKITEGSSREFGLEQFLSE